MQRRTIMNLVLLGGAGVPVLWLGGGFVYFFVRGGEGSSGQTRERTSSSAFLRSRVFGRGHLVIVVWGLFGLHWGLFSVLGECSLQNSLWGARPVSEY